MAIGPIQAFVIGFPDNDKFEGRIVEELGRLRGELNVVAVSDLDDEERAELRAAVGALIGLGVAGADGAEAGAVLGATMDPDAPTAAQAVAAELVDALPDGSSALVLAIEHLWAIPLRDAVRDAGGLVLAHRSITVEELIALGIGLGDSAAEDDADDAAAE